MAMYVTIKKDISALQSLSHHHFGRTIFRALLHARSYPLTVEIQSTERCPIISNEYSIWVEHRDNLKHEVVPQVLCYFII